MPMIIFMDGVRMNGWNHSNVFVENSSQPQARFGHFLGFRKSRRCFRRLPG